MMPLPAVNRQTARTGLLAALFLLCGAFLFGQAIDRANYKGFQSGHVIYHWTTSNGLPQSHISGITQSRNRLLWVGTYNGVVSFDGRRFSPVDLAHPGHKLSPFVTAIKAFGDTIVWATPQEIVLYYNHHVVAVHPVKELNVFIGSIHRFRGKYYFIAHDRVYYLEGKTLKPLVNTAVHKELSGSTILTGLFHDDRLLCLVRNGDGQTFHYVYDYTTKKRQVVPTREPVENLTLYHEKPIVLTGTTWKNLDRAFQPKDVVHRNLPAIAGERVQYGNESGCFFSYSRSQVVVTYDDGKPSVLNTGQILYGNELFASFRDYAGNLWLGTNSMGLFMLRKYPFRLINFFQQEPITNSSHAFLDREGLLWFDNDCKVTLGVDLKNDRIAHALPNTCNWTNADWTNDSLALFAYGTTHYWYNKRTRSRTGMTDIRVPITNYLRTGPRSFILAGEGQLYHWYGKKLQPWKRFLSEKTTCNELLAVGKDHYFATSEGLYRERGGSWKLIDGKGIVTEPDFRSLLQLKGTPYLLIGTTRDGVLRYHLRTGKLEKLAVIPTQLQSCWSMVEDRFGQLWITSNKGIVQCFTDDLMASFDQQKDLLEMNHYRYEHGLDNVEFNSRTQNKGRLLPDGSILFSSLGGPVVVVPESQHSFASTMGQLLIERVQVNDLPRELTGEKLLLTEGDFVQLQFTIASFATERVLSFEYRIAGYRNNWAPIQNRQITLDNLPTGEYKLEIRTAYGRRRLVLPITVEARYPNAWILYLLIALGGMVLIVLVTVVLTKRAQQKKHAMTTLKQQLKLLEMEALRSQMNPHFIFNCLNTIQFLFISGNVSRANKYLTNFSALMRMTLDLLRQPITTLDLELKATNLYIELEQLQFDDGFEFRFVNNLKTPVNIIRIPSLFFQIFVENAILHGLRKTTELKPILTLILEETDDSFVFRICDNGPGISTNTREDHTSMGIKLLRDRFALKREIYNWHIDFSMHEHRVIENDIKTEIIITFGKVLLESTEDEYLDRR